MAERTSDRLVCVPSTSGHYYAAFVLDPDGNNVEAVFHTPTELVIE
jgi:hypothetical protein